MNEKILEVTEKLARKAMSLKGNYASSKFSVGGKAVDITMSNGIITAKISFPRQLIEETLDAVSQGYTVDAIMNQFCPPEKSLPHSKSVEEDIEDMEEEEMAEEVPVTEEVVNKPTKKMIKKKG